MFPIIRENPGTVLSVICPRTVMTNIFVIDLILLLAKENFKSAIGKLRLSLGSTSSIVNNNKKSNKRI